MERTKEERREEIGRVGPRNVGQTDTNVDIYIFCILYQHRMMVLHLFQVSIKIDDFWGLIN